LCCRGAGCCEACQPCLGEVGLANSGVVRPVQEQHGLISTIASPGERRRCPELLDRPLKVAPVRAMDDTTPAAIATYDDTIWPHTPIPPLNAPGAQLSRIRRLLRRELSADANLALRTSHTSRTSHRFLPSCRPISDDRLAAALSTTCSRGVVCLASPAWHSVGDLYRGHRGSASFLPPSMK